MSIGDKPVNAIFTENGYCREASIHTKGSASGLTYREWLIGMLASNPAMVKTDKKIIDRSVDIITEETILHLEDSAEVITQFADAIIKQLDKESE